MTAILEPRAYKTVSKGLQDGEQGKGTPSHQGCLCARSLSRELRGLAGSLGAQVLARPRLLWNRPSESLDEATEVGCVTLDLDLD
jgi:hypothetical protein